MNILYTGPHQKVDKEREIGAKYVDLETLLKMQTLLQLMLLIIQAFITKLTKRNLK